jgi:hypothetical protein
MKASFCTLAIHAPYRERARRLCEDLAPAPLFILTDEPGDFSDLNAHAIFHIPTGPMAADYLRKGTPTGQGRGAAAYHDKRFALLAALKDFDTAIFLDADSRLQRPLPALPFRPGLSVIPVVRRSIRTHLETCGSWRLPAFEKLALALFGNVHVLEQAPWCHETCIAVTKDGREGGFFHAWGEAARLMQAQDVFSGEGGVIGLAAHSAGWQPNYETLNPLAELLRHEGGGPKPA